MKLDKKFWTEGTGSMIIAVVVALTIRWAFMEAYVIPSGSMLPTLLINDHIFVNKFVYGIRVPFTENWLWRNNEPKRGEIVVFRYPESPDTFYIKRVVGVPGDRVFYENGDLYINYQIIEKRVPQELKADYDWVRDVDLGDGPGAKNYYVHWVEQLGDQKYSTLLRKNRDWSTFGPYTVPEDSYFVMGDNRDNSKDSRLWSSTNYVPRKYLIGRAMFVWLSCDETLPVITFLCNPLELRWKRFFHSVHQ
jgi:signal peptidase I